MARNIPQVVIDALGVSEITYAHLLKFTDGSLDYRYTNLDVDVWTDADGSLQQYESRGFKFDSINYSLSNVVDSLSMTIDNLDHRMTAIFGGPDIRGNKASIWVNVFNDTTSLANVLLFSGQLDGFNLDETELRLSINSLFVNWQHSSFSKHSISCRWCKFQGIECRYAGAETGCDRSYETCIKLLNTAHFGGYRWLSDVENKTIWWGPTPDEMK